MCYLMSAVEKINKMFSPNKLGFIDVLSTLDAK